MCKQIRYAALWIAVVALFFQCQSSLWGLGTAVPLTQFDSCASQTGPDDEEGDPACQDAENEDEKENEEQEGDKDGDPVDLSSGAFSYDADLLGVSFGAFDVHFHVSYLSSAEGWPSSVAPRWTHNFDQKIVIRVEKGPVVSPYSGPGDLANGNHGGIPEPGEAEELQTYIFKAFHFDNLRIDEYELDDSEYFRWRPVDTSGKKLISDTSVYHGVQPQLPEKFIIRSADGTLTEFERPTGFLYDLLCRQWDTATYRPSSMTFPGGEQVFFGYQWVNKTTFCGDADSYRRMSWISSASGATLNLTYSGSGLLEAVEDHTGRRVDILHDGRGNITEIQGPEISSGMVDPQAAPYRPTTKFSYGRFVPNTPKLGHNMVSITAPNQNSSGAGVPYVINAWNAEQTIVNKQHYGGKSINGPDAGGFFSFIRQDQVIQHSWFTENRRVLVIDPNGNASLSVFDSNDRLRLRYQFEGRLTHPANPGNELVSDYVVVDPSNYSLGGQLLNAELPMGSNVNSTGARANRYDYSSYGLLLREESESSVTEFVYDFNSPDVHQRFNLLKKIQVSTLNPSERIVKAYSYDPLFNSPRVEYFPSGASTHSPPNASPIVNQRKRYSTSYFYDYQEGPQSAVQDLIDTWEIDVNQASAAAELTLEGVAFLPVDFALGDSGGNSNGIVDEPRGHAVRRTALFTSPLDPRVSATTFELVDSTKLYSYNSFGLLKSVTDDRGSVTNLQYFLQSDPTGIGGGAAGPDQGGFLAIRTSAVGTSEVLEESFAYNDLGQVTAITDAAGRESAWVYDSRGQVVQHLAASGLATFFSYDSNGNLVRIEARNGTDGWAARAPADLQEPTLHTALVELSYDILDHLIGQTEFYNGTSASYVYRYDRAENLVLTLFPEWDKDSTHVRASIVDEYGRAFLDGHGGLPKGFKSLAANADIPELLIIPETPPGYSENRNRYSQGLLLEVTNGSGETSKKEHDGFGREIASEDPLGNRLEYGYDVEGRVLTKRSFDSLGALVAESRNDFDELGQQYAKHHLVLDVPSVLVDGPLTPGDGFVSEFTKYNSSGDPVLEVTDELVWSENNFNALGQVTGVLDSGGNEWFGYYDRVGNLIHTKTELNATDGGPPLVTQQWKFHDLLGRLTAQAVKNGDQAWVTRHVYDLLGNLVLTTNAKGSFQGGLLLASLDTTSQHIAPAPPLPALTINGHGNAEIYQVDGRGLVTTTSKVLRVGGDGAGAIATSGGGGDGFASAHYGYDRNGRLISRMDDSGAETVYGYDSLNRMESILYPDLNSKTVAYTKTGKIDTVVDRSGTLLKRTYDQADRLTAIDVTPAAGVLGPLRYEYDQDSIGRIVAGRTLGANGILNATGLKFDSMSNVIEWTTNGRTSRASYDGDGNAMSFEYPSGRTVTVDRADNLRRAVGVSRNGSNNPFVTYEYLGAGNGSSRILENGVQTDFSYSEIGDIESVSASSPAGVLLDVHSVWSSGGSRVGRSDLISGISRTFHYDSLEQMDRALLVHPTNGPRLIRYTLNAMGGREHLSNGALAGDWASLSPMHFYDTAPGVDFVHDANANLTSKIIGGAGPGSSPSTLEMGYDAKNLMVRTGWVEQGEFLEIEHDAFGNRVLERTMVSGVQTNRVDLAYLPNGALAEEWDHSGILNRVFYYGNNSNIPLIQERVHSGGSEHLYALTDEMSNMLGLLDASGNVVESYEYEDYGEPVDPVSWTLLSSSPKGNRYLFAGKRIDWLSGLYDSAARMYDPSTGRFTSADPMGAWFDIGNRGNGYTYAGNNPWTLVDPSGLSTHVPEAPDKPDVRGNIEHHGSSSGTEGPQGELGGDTRHHGSVSGKQGKSGKRISDKEYAEKKRIERETRQFHEAVLRNFAKNYDEHGLEHKDVKEMRDVIKADYASPEERGKALKKSFEKYMEKTSEWGDAEWEKSRRALKTSALVGRAAAVTTAYVDEWTAGISTEISEAIGGQEYEKAQRELEERFPGETRAGRAFAQATSVPVKQVAKGVAVAAVKFTSKVSNKWGINRLKKELRDQGFTYTGTMTRDSKSLCFKNAKTGEEYRIHQNPGRPMFRNEIGKSAEEKFKSKWYYHRRPHGSAEWGPHVSIPDK